MIYLELMIKIGNYNFGYKDSIIREFIKGNETEKEMMDWIKELLIISKYLIKLILFSWCNIFLETRLQIENN